MQAPAESTVRTRSGSSHHVAPNGTLEAVILLTNEAGGSDEHAPLLCELWLLARSYAHMELRRAANTSTPDAVAAAPNMQGAREVSATTATIEFQIIELERTQLVEQNWQA